MNNSSDNQRILAVDPYDRGFGYVVLEGPSILIDWGITAADRRTATRYLSSLQKLFDRFEPDILVTESGAREGSSRRRETWLLLKRIRRYAKQRKLKTRVYSRAGVEDAFSGFGIRTKHQIATVIAKWFPELALRLPKPQQTFTGENRSMSIFDAMSFALTYFHLDDIQPLTERWPPPLSFSASAGSVSPGKIQDQEDARLSCPIRAFPWLRPEKISPYTFSHRDGEQGGTPMEVKVWRY